MAKSKQQQYDDEVKRLDQERTQKWNQYLRDHKLKSGVFVNDAHRKYKNQLDDEFQTEALKARRRILG